MRGCAGARVRCGSSLLSGADEVKEGKVTMCFDDDKGELVTRWCYTFEFWLFGVKQEDIVKDDVYV